MATVDIVRLIQDEHYANSLSRDQWHDLVRSTEWDLMTGENPELIAPIVQKYGDRLPLPSRDAGEGGFGPGTNKSLGATKLDVLGTRIPRRQGLGIVTGVGRYVQHMAPKTALFMRTLRSPHPHAKVLKVDTSKAEKLPGVRAVLHRAVLPKEYADVRLGGGPPYRDLFNEEVFEVGSPIACVAAENEHIADEALRLIEVQYQVLPAALNMLEAMKSATPKQFDSKLDGTTINIQTPFKRGDVAKGFADADVTVENVSSRATEQHMPLEMTTSLSWWDNGKLTMYYTCQHSHGSRDALASALKLPQANVRVIQPGYMGSGYGYRSSVDLTEIHAAIMAKVTGRPMRAMYTRSEDFVTRTHRPQFQNESKLGIKKDGTIVALQVKVIANVGAQRATAASGAWYNMQMMYTIPNVMLEGVDVFTNSYKSGPYRCVSHPAGTLALETILDMAAYKIGMDPVEVRLKNLNLYGDVDAKRPYSNPGIKTCIEQASKAIGWKEKFHAPKAKEVRPGVFHGISLVAANCNHGAGSSNAAGMVIITSDGTLQVISGSTDIGPGQKTLQAMIAAETVGIPYERTNISLETDTEFAPDNSGTNGSRQTNTAGWGTYEAAMDARRQVLEWAAKKFIADAKRATPPQTLTVKPEELDVVKGEVVFKNDATKKLKISDLIAFSTGPIIGRGVHQQDPTWERAAMWSHAAEIEVDTNTGTIKILKYVAAHDVGKALNPFALEQQIEGGVIMGIGAALTEELKIDAATGLPLNDNILDYKALTIKDVPRTIDCVIVEHEKEYGVYGAHGIGEPPINPVGAVIANAIYNAIGVRVDKMPLTREKILAALKA
ncbi:MAG: xanthine dehydrogenase family protein molybdopterin-binding subunit [Chloroflexi bacterium]|nr:xanthine dehydrogenase family protein molybdopterin-binding subunit [Chloroflexota bacterium]